MSRLGHIERVPDIRAFGDRPATEDDIARISNRPAFRQSRAEQLALFIAGDQAR
ncbi:MAG: hypothetical protein ACK4FG_07820 [Brevundimonas sp.]